MLTCKRVSSFANNIIIIGMNSMLPSFVVSEKNIPMSIKTALRDSVRSTNTICQQSITTVGRYRKPITTPLPNLMSAESVAIYKNGP